MTEIAMETLPPQPELGRRLTVIRQTRKLSRKKFKEASGGAVTEGKFYNLEQGRELKAGEAEGLIMALKALGIPLSITDEPLPEPGAPVQSGVAPASTPQPVPVPPSPSPVEIARRLILESHARGEHKGIVPNCARCAEAAPKPTDVIASPAQVGAAGPRLEEPTIYTVISEEEGEETDPFSHRSATVEAPRFLTNGQIQAFKRCKRKFWLAFYRGLVFNGEDMSGPRAVGSRVHRALAAWYTADTESRLAPLPALERAIVEDWTIVANRLQAEIGDQWQEDARAQDITQKFLQSNDLERAMVEGYTQWLAETGEDQGLVVVESERILYSDLPLGDGRWIRLAGTIDARVLRQSDGVRLFIDHKTKPDLTKFRRTLHMDEQMLTYHLLEFLTSKDGEARCDGALYNILRRVKRTDRAKPPFYDRVEVPHTDAELELFKERILGEASAILDLIEALDDGADPLRVAYPTPTEACAWDCDFVAICPLFDDKASHAEAAVAAYYHHEDPQDRYDFTAAKK